MIKILSKIDTERLDVWYNNILQSIENSRWLNESCYFLEKEIESAWNKIYMMDDSNIGLSVIRFERDKPDISAMVAYWSLNAKNTKVASQHFLFVRKQLKRFGVRSIHCSVMESNAKSLAICTKSFGPPWGIEPDGAWDKYLCKYVNFYRFGRKLT